MHPVDAVMHVLALPLRWHGVARRASA